MKTKIELEDNELMILDGKVSEDIQKIIDSVKSRIEIEATASELTPELASMLVKMVGYARNNGHLGFQRISLTYCPTCKKSAGYAKYKSGRNKGLNNLSKPLSFNGVNLSKSLVSVRGHTSLGCCNECWDILKPHLLKHLDGVQSEVSEYLTGVKPRYKRYDLRKCSKCGWEGSERHMGRKRTMMGDGTYPASCPACEAENLFLGPTVVGHVKGFEIYDPETKKGEMVQ